MAAPAQLPQAKARKAIGLPARLEIPSIRVNAVVRSVGLATDGSMGVPKIPSETAWYMYGPKPGDRGSAVIAGHVNWYYGETGAFARLKSLKPGDKITVQDERGATTTFAVRTSRTYGQNDDATSVFFSYDGQSHLNLVTCDGVWDRVSRAYTKRFVVFADRVGE
jgi:sortase A